MADFVSALSTIGTNPTLSAADVVALQAMTVNNEHGQRRSIQNPKNNLKNSSGIERIPFNGLEELDTEYGSNLATTPLFNRTVHALNDGDSRIRFVGNGWDVISESNRGTNLRTASTTDYVEITFFGTGLNILTVTNSGARTIIPVVDGTTGTDIYPGTFSDALEPANRNVKINQVLPVRSGLTAGVHTIRLSQTNASSATPFNLYGCEIINESAAITQQPGADFDGRVSLLTGTDVPIEPTVATAGTAYRLNAMDTKTGARVLNYLTSGGQFKQSFTDAIESVVEAGGTGTTYTVQFNSTDTTPFAGTATIPAATSTIRIITFGGGGRGDGGAGGAGGGGGARSEVIYTRDGGNTSTLAFTSAVGQADTQSTASLAATLVATAGAGGTGGSGIPGTGGIADVPDTAPTITGWTRGQITELNGSTGGGPGGGGSGGAGGGVGGNINTATAPRGNDGALAPLLQTSAVAGRVEGSGGQQTSTGDPRTAVDGIAPGGGGSGATSGGPDFGLGAHGRTYLIYTLATAVDPVTNGTFTSANAFEVGTPQERFSLANHTNQDVIRRINWREFGANDQWSTFNSANNTSLAFTLNDDTTTLTGSLIRYRAATADHPEYPHDAGEGFTGGGYTITFVGTGLDVFMGFEALNGGVNEEVFVDGFNIGRIPQNLYGNNPETGTATQAAGASIIPIVSGLAYGTHTVFFTRGSSPANGAVTGVIDYIIYGPKKPEISTLDVGSLELSDYNIMADHVDTPNSGNTSVGKGVLRKIVTREVLLPGTWSLDLASPVSIGGVLVSSALSGSELNYTFYGTGLEFRFRFNAGEILEFDIDGTTRSLAAADFVGVNTVTFSDNGGVTNARITKNAGGDSNDNAAYIIDDLTLGVHTFTVRLETSAGSFFAKSLDIITPIHINDSNLKVGSEGLNNLTIDPVVEEDEQVTLAKLGEAKAWGRLNNGGATARIDASFNVAAYVRLSSENSLVFFDKPFKSPPTVVLGIGVAGATGSLVASNFANTDQGPTETNGFRIRTTNLLNPDYLSFVAYGELIDE